jgi:hypothetical protein
VKKYSDILEPRMGTAKKAEIDKFLGQATQCTSQGEYEECEYRTARGKNEPVPAVHTKAPAMGPDLAPYEHFDVIRVKYDSLGILREWKPIHLR